MSDNIDRRDFLKRAGAGALAIGTASLTMFIPPFQFS